MVGSKFVLELDCKPLRSGIGGWIVEISGNWQHGPIRSAEQKHTLTFHQSAEERGGSGSHASGGEDRRAPPPGPYLPQLRSALFNGPGNTASGPDQITSNALQRTQARRSAEARRGGAGGGGGGPLRAPPSSNGARGAAGADVMGHGNAAAFRRVARAFREFEETFFLAFPPNVLFQHLQG